MYKKNSLFELLLLLLIKLLFKYLSRVYKRLHNGNFNEAYNIIFVRRMKFYPDWDAFAEKKINVDRTYICILMHINIYCS